MSWRVEQGDCVGVMAAMDAGSVDAVVCDPPYFLSFMGKAWDTIGPGEQQREHERWAREALRVLKPGGHLLAFGGTRTYHRLACAVEDAGFEVRDTIAWMYGSGFPKSLDVSKAIDKAAGAEREVVGSYERGMAMHPGNEGVDSWRETYTGRVDVTAPATPDAERWSGWGTALKPAHEPIVVARKPLAGTVAGNVLAHGTGALNVDGCRVGFAGEEDERESKGKNRPGDFGTEHGGNAVYGDYTRDEPRANYDPVGRWPANVVLDPEAGELLDQQSGELASGNHPAVRRGIGYGSSARGTEGEQRSTGVGGASRFFFIAQRSNIEVRRRGLNSALGSVPSDAATPPSAAVGAQDFARFKYCAKTSREERNAGLDGFAAKPLEWSSGDENPGSFQRDGTDRSARNPHPTVKPIELMRWLVRLVTPPGGLVLDPFVGSGTTGCAAVLEGFEFVGIERDPEYVEIARARVGWWAEHPAGVELVRALEGNARRRRVAESGQGTLL